MASIKTRILIVSDTHGDDLIHKPTGTYDVAIHCGDLTEESKLDEFRVSLNMMLAIQAPLKLIIAGNHDFSMDIPVLANKLADNTTAEDSDLVKRTYGDPGEVRAMFETDATKAAGVVLLDEGNHSFKLANGATLSVYASPYTASKAWTWGFQYQPSDEHAWDIKPNTDVVITHSPPHGVLDYTSNKTRAGSPSLFAAVAKAKPKMHCFGHIHEAWGAKVVGWRQTETENPTHFTAIDNDRSILVESITSLSIGKFDTLESSAEKVAKRERYDRQGYCIVAQGLENDQTLFVNAAIEGPSEGVQQHPWVVELDLPASA
jgi:Icc-related predicted phosphoesterase